MVGDQAAALQQQQVVKGLKHSKCGISPAELCRQSSSAHKLTYPPDPQSGQHVGMRERMSIRARADRR